MASSGRKRGGVLGHDGREEHDLAYRRTSVVEVSSETVASIEFVLAVHLPRLEQFFDVPLELIHEPQFLTYRTGDFFVPHTDSRTTETTPDAVRDREVSVVIFLNGRGSPPGEAYDGGELVFHASGDQLSDRLELAVSGKAGALVAFKSDLMHAVSPVQSGLRHSVVAWLQKPSG